MKGTPCPISCGECCGACERRTPSGCMDPRGKRPSYCRTFLCEYAEAVLAGRMGKDEARIAVKAEWNRGWQGGEQ